MVSSPDLDQLCTGRGALALLGEVARSGEVVEHLVSSNGLFVADVRGRHSGRTCLEQVRSSHPQSNPRNLGKWLNIGRSLIPRVQRDESPCTNAVIKKICTVRLWATRGQRSRERYFRIKPSTPAGSRSVSAIAAISSASRHACSSR